jgi:hypothetical protein
MLSCDPRVVADFRLKRRLLVHTRSKHLPNNKFSPDEDARLLGLVGTYGKANWTHIATMMENRNPRQCRERYANYLNPALRQDVWTPDEDRLLAQKYREFGSKWNKIAKFFINRSDIALRNRWQLIERHRTKTVQNHQPIGQIVTVPEVVSIPKPESKQIVAQDFFDRVQLLDDAAAADDSPWWEFGLN